MITLSLFIYTLVPQMFVQSTLRKLSWITSLKLFVPNFIIFVLNKVRNHQWHTQGPIVTQGLKVPIIMQGLIITRPTTILILNKTASSMDTKILNVDGMGVRQIGEQQRCRRQGGHRWGVVGGRPGQQACQDRFRSEERQVTRL
mmetsp:Transcript_26477/g.69602  ORF Transcript_26477/g.69602 Transcript_26477/m.69602 type:complete len:144 (-) Transcript_26477:391-822(-)